LLVEFYWPVQVLTEQDFPIGCYQRLACGVLLLATTLCGRIFLLAAALKAIGKLKHKESLGIVKLLVNYFTHMEIHSGLPILVSNCSKACLYLYYCFFRLAYILQAVAIGLPTPFEQFLPAEYEVSSKQASV